MKSPTTETARRFPILWLVAGFGLWSLTFLTLYMVLTLGCAFRWHMTDHAFGLSLQRIVLVTLALLACIANIGMIRLYRRSELHERRDTIGVAADRLNIVALFCIIFTFGPVVALSPCH
jgi:hypothetical protein